MDYDSIGITYLVLRVFRVHVKIYTLKVMLKHYNIIILKSPY